MIRFMNQAKPIKLFSTQLRGENQTITFKGSMHIDRFISIPQVNVQQLCRCKVNSLWLESKLFLSKTNKYVLSEKYTEVTAY